MHSNSYPKGRDSISTSLISTYKRFRVSINKFCRRVIDRRITSSTLLHFIKHQEKKQQVRTLLSMPDCCETVHHKMYNETRRLNVWQACNRVWSDGTQGDFVLFSSKSYLSHLPTVKNTLYPSLSSPLRISFWAWADMRTKNTHVLPDVRDLLPEPFVSPTMWPKETEALETRMN